MDVPVEIRRRTARFVEREEGRITYHSFSFGAAYDPGRLRFGPMVCHDDHHLGRGRGFPPHTHSGLVVVTRVLSGALEHTDSTGTTTLVEPGSVAVLHAGSGVEHSEIAAAPQTRFVQVWLALDDDSGAAGDPSYAVVPGDAVDLPGASMRAHRLDGGERLTLPAAPRQHVFVATGALTRFSLAEPLSAGDAIEMVDHPEAEVTAAVASELLVWTFTA